jgi:hypothetical protein
MNEDASDPNADTGDDLGREADRFKKQLQRDVQSWFADESVPSERQRDAALNLGAQQTKGVTDAAKKLSKRRRPSAPAKLIEGKGRPFSMSYDGLTFAQHLENRRARGAR